MIRIVNPLLHTKYIRTDCLRSVFLWWTPQSLNTFLQFGNWEKTNYGAVVSYNQIWKYPSFHLAYSDLTSIKKQVPRLESKVLQYQIEPTLNVLVRGAVPSFVNAAFTEFTFHSADSRTGW
jgi:hypothetical protein